MRKGIGLSENNHLGDGYFAELKEREVFIMAKRST
jgi:hypothetical protein